MKIKKIMRNVRMTTVLSIVSITLTIIPVIVSAIYSFLQADDFSHANGVGVFGGNIFELFIASIQYAKEMFETWQGTYTSMFLQAFLSPLNGLGMPQLRVVMVVNIVLFIASVVALIYSICEYCHIDREKTVILIAIVIICIFGFNAWTEVFNWFSGAVSYSFPLSFGFLGIAVMLTAKKKGGYFLSAVLMFLASGGSLTVGGACCAILITICIAKKMVGLITKKDCIIFFIAVIGALINTLAPGNYIRHAAFDAEGVHFGIALVLSIYESVDMIENLLYNTPFLLLMVIVFIIGIDAGKKKLADRRCLFTIQFFSVLILLATCFPICLGYNGRDIPNRGKFAETVIAVIILTTITMTTGYLLSGKWKEIKVNQVCIVFAFVYIVSYTNSTWRISELIPYKMWEQVAAKSYKDYYNTVNEVYNKIAKDKNDNVFICNIQGGGYTKFSNNEVVGGYVGLD